MTFRLRPLYFHILFSITFVYTASAQAPQAINYQGIARNGAGQTLLNQSVGIRLSILDSSSMGTAVYVETHHTITSNKGLFNLSIGAGTVVSGNFSSINWGQSSKWLKTEMDASGGTNYQPIGTTQFLSVPYSVFSDKSGNGMPNGVNTGDILYWNGSTWVPVPLPGGSPSQRSTSTSRSASAQTAVNANGSDNGNGLGLALCNGIPAWGGCPLTISTSPISQVSYTSAVSGGNITTTNNIYILASGVCYGTAPNPTVSGNKTTDGNGGNFISTITGLLPNTTYYVRAYGTQGFGTTYGDEISFTTLPLTVPSVSTGEAGNISNTTAQCGGVISSDGGAIITARGVCWSTNSNPTLANQFTSDGTGVGTYISNLTGLSPSATYYVRAYASNSIGTAYGNEISFTSNIVELPTITTTAATSITYTRASSGGNITSEGGAPVTTRGICWSTSPNPTIANNSASAGSGMGSFVASLTSLTPNTTYYVRAFATNLGGTTYGNQQSFNTLALILPTVTTTTISGISSTSAVGGGTVTDEGGSTVSVRGICWSTSQGPTTSGSKTTDGSGTGNYFSILTNLSFSTTYYVRAYATNSVGTAYGSEVSFTTASSVPAFSVPIVGIKTVTVNSGNTSASSGGYISYDGGSAVTARGICWSTGQNPTLANDFSSDGTGIGTFSSTINHNTGCNVTYYVRAYATNSTGTGYSNQVSFSTGIEPSGISTTAVSNIAANSATSGGTIVSDEGCLITARGVCWSYTNNMPTTADSKTIDGSGTGTFTSSITGLLSNVTYYVRAYATNIKGTAYGNLQVLTTTGPPSFYIGQAYGGGIVCYIDGSGQHGLIAATSDQGIVFWGCLGTSIPGANGTAVGTGASNTAAIVANCSQSGIAARICDELVLNGYSDWFLPSYDELALMYQYRTLIGGFSPNFYWSSSEYGVNHARLLHFVDGGLGSGRKENDDGLSDPWYVRAVRAF